MLKVIEENSTYIEAFGLNEVVFDEDLNGAPGLDDLVESFFRERLRGNALRLCNQKKDPNGNLDWSRP